MTAQPLDGVLITGGSSGLGAATVAAVLRRGGVPLDWLPKRVSNKSLG